MAPLDDRTSPRTGAMGVEINDAEITADTRDVPAIQPRAEITGTRARSADAVNAQAALMHRDEAARLHLFARLSVLMVATGTLAQTVLGGHPLARSVFLIGTAVSMPGFLLMAHLTRQAETFRPSSVGLLFHIMFLAGHGASYYFGIHSPFSSVLAIALYVIGLGSSSVHIHLAYANVVIGQAVVTALVISGVLPELSLLRTGDLGIDQRIVLHLCAQLVYLFAFLLGRIGRARTLAAVRDLQDAVHEIATREALLAEARQALARAERGGPGRYTDHAIGSYRLGAVIGRGAMGEIYEAIHVVTGQQAAVKLLSSHAIDDTGMKRFVREARLAASLSAPNLVRVHEVADDDAAVPYLAMERLTGQDLGHMLRERTVLGLAEVVVMVEQVSAALEVARQAGIVHRDIKPQNLFLHHGGATPVWKVLDFGVSKLASADSSLTGTNLIGTPAYMAPEQARGHHVDHRADVYSLGVIVYRCLTGRPAFSGSDIPRVLYDVVHTMPERPSSLADVSPEVEAVLALAMAKRPESRFSSARELGRALALAARGELPEAVRARAAAILVRHPWGSEL